MYVLFDLITSKINFIYIHIYNQQTFRSTYEDDGADPDAQLMEVDDDAVDNDVTMANEEYERVLPSGVVIGNRKLMRYNYLL